MNKHIELVKKWLDDPNSVTEDELKDNATEVAYLGYAAYAAAYAAADAAAYAVPADNVEPYVKKYEELTEGKENE
tara:strand:- start:204 stop:428 length:225 start_codon:yes stop_codon:yes gene_type:complete